MFLLVKSIIQVVLSISSIQHREKMATLLIFYYKVSVWRLLINVEGERKRLLQRSRCGQRQKFGGCYIGTARCIVHHPGFEETGED